MIIIFFFFYLFLIFFFFNQLWIVNSRCLATKIKTFLPQSLLFGIFFLFNYFFVQYGSTLN